MTNALDSSAINTSRKKNKSGKKKWILLLVVGGLTIMFVIAAYSESVEKAQKIAASQNIQAKQSEVDTSSASLTKKEHEDRKPPTSPTMMSVNEDQKKDKKAAAEKGLSHIDSADVLAQQEEVVVDLSSATKVEAKAEPVTEVTEEPETTAETESQPQPPSREEILRKHMSILFKSNLEKHYPSSLVDTQAYVSEFKSKYGNLGDSPNQFFATEGSLIATNSHTTTMEQDKARREQLEAQKLAETNRNNEALAQDDPNYNPANDPTLVRVLNMGDLATGTIKDAINSDFNLDVFIDLHDAPLTGTRLRASFEINQMQDGILLKVNQLQYKDHVQAVDGYAVDITIDNSPLFDNDVDTHFVKRFLARASAAAVLPWIDFVTATTTTITGDNIITDNPIVENTTDRIIGSLGSVAKEFIPDLRKNANLPPTVSVPKNWPVGVVFVNPLYLPKGLFDEDETTNPDNSYENVFSSSTH